MAAISSCIFNSNRVSVAGINRICRLRIIISFSMSAYSSNIIF